jgi:hypothetical protein
MLPGVSLSVGWYPPTPEFMLRIVRRIPGSARVIPVLVRVHWPLAFVVQDVPPEPPSTHTPFTTTFAAGLWPESCTVTVTDADHVVVPVIVLVLFVAPRWNPEIVVVSVALLLAVFVST